MVDLPRSGTKQRKRVGRAGLPDLLAANAHYQYKPGPKYRGSEPIIREGRHPVIEHNLPVGESFIANDLELNKTDQQIIALTGPNTGGERAAAANCFDYADGPYRQFYAGPPKPGSR